MKHLFALVAACLLLSAWTLADDAKPATANEEQALVKMEKESTAAIKSADADALGKLLADDFTLTGPTGAVFEKDQYLGDLRNHTLALESAKADDVKVRVYGNAAVITGTLAIAGKYGDFDLTGSYRFTDTLVKTNGHWQKVAQQLTATRD